MLHMKYKDIPVDCNAITLRNGKFNASFTVYIHGFGGDAYHVPDAVDDADTPEIAERSAFEAAKRYIDTNVA